MDVAVLGSRPLASQCMNILHESGRITVKAVVTYPPDEETWWEGSLYEKAMDLGVPVVEESELFEFELDYLLSIQYDFILGEDLLNHPSEGALNLHQAELPRYRGCNVFSHAIMNARKDDHWRHGTTLHFMTPKIDAGDIVARRFIEITEDDTAKSLYRRTEARSVELFEEMVPKIASNEVQQMRQPQHTFDGKTYYHSRDSLDGLKEIDPDRLRTTDEEEQLAIYDRIRALDFPPFEPAYTRFGGKKIYLTKTSYEDLLDD